MFVSGSEMETLWSTSQIANDLGVDKYQVMYPYEANKGFFVNNDINAPEQIEITLLTYLLLKLSMFPLQLYSKTTCFCHC